MSQEQLNKIKKVAVKAGELAISYQKELATLHVREKGIGDFVTKADIECEELIKRELNKDFEGFSFLAEESGVENNNSDYCWIIDPIDGTKNFLKGSSFFSCCICLQEKKKTIVSVIYFPALDELYYASRDKDGAFLELPKSNKETITLNCSKKVDLTNSLVAYGISRNNFDRVSHMMKRLSTKSAGIRTLGSASADIIKVATGEFAAYIKPNINEWDLYPAGYIAKKAGAGIYDIHGEKIEDVFNYDSKKHGCIVANKHVIEDLKEAIKPTIDKSIEVAKEVYEEKICPLTNKAVETSTPYVKKACKRSKPHMKSFINFCKQIYIKIKPLCIKTWTVIKKLSIKSKPYIVKAVIWIKDMVVKLFNSIFKKK